ncbi:MAG: adenylosuccinate lyase [Candidatus Liptonbacteria bacterium]|nr:adenylosuccinate lyase [Candidatus Liptonbacteria bacterium]
MNFLESISPIDGRYREYTEPLAKIFSEAGMMRYRLFVEAEYLIALSEHPDIGPHTKNFGERAGLRDFSEEEKSLIRNLSELTLENAKIIKDIERAGYKNIKATDHDVKAIEYFMRDQLENTSLKDCLEWIHFALTSEDIDNLAYGLMLSDGIEKVILPLLEKITAKLEEFAKEYKNLTMLARTHGQPATPTTFGKEFKVFAARLERQIGQLRSFRILVKLNGATGNYSANVVAYPEVDWLDFTKNFVTRLREHSHILQNVRMSSGAGGAAQNQKKTITLEPNLFTTQIEPHDTYVELFDLLRRINTILIDFNQDIWRYISDGWIAQKANEGEIGSSTMPHKINPIKFENSEGNLGIANSLFSYFSSKLPISRLQRDLSDSTVERNFGVALAHSVVAYANLLNGLGRIQANKEKVLEDLNLHPEVIAEAIQTVLRREGVAMPYEKLKVLTRGKTVTIEDMRAFINGLDVSAQVKEELLKITPESYVGLAEKLASGEL